MKTVAGMTALVLLAPIAGWAQSKIDVSNHSITCNTLIGTASSKPSLVVGGTAQSRKMIVRGTLAGCTVTGPTPVTILSGKTTGKVTAMSNECVTLHEPLAGTMTIKWKADPSTPILQRSSTIEVTDVTFGGFAAPWGASYGLFSLGMGGVTGAFTGGDDGAQSSNAQLTSQDIAEILSECGSPDGLKTVRTGLGTLTLK